MQMTTAPTASYAEAERQRALADSLQQRALAPRNMQGMQGNDALFLGMTQLGEALLAAKMGKKASKAEGAADAQMRDANAAAIEKLAGPYQIESVDVGGEGTPLAGGALPGSQIQTALAGTDPRQANQIVANALLQRAIPAPLDPDKAAQRALDKERIAGEREDRAAALAQRAAEAEQRSKDAAATREDRARAAQEANELRRQLGQMQADSARYAADARRDAASAGQALKVDAADEKKQGRIAALEAAKGALARVQATSDKLAGGGGFMEGRLPAMGAMAQDYDGAVAQLLAAIQSALRVPGIGSQSNMELQALIGALPMRTQEQSVRNEQIKGIASRLQTIIGRENGEAPQEPPASAAGAQKKVIRTGTSNGRKVVMYDDGTTAYAD